MIDDRTPNLSLPLPHRDNDLTVDVERLRQALNALDGSLSALEQAMVAVNALLESDDETLDQMQELVAAIKANRTDVMALVLAKADKTALAVQEEVQTLDADQTVIDLLELDSAAGCSVFVEGVRLNKLDWAQDPGNPKRITLARSYPASHSIAVVRLQGGV